MKIKRYWNLFNDLLGNTIIHPQYFVKVTERETIEEAKHLAKGVFLDIGCGRQYYRKEIEPLVKRYYGLDHPKVSELYETVYPVEIKSDATAIPLASRSVDTAMMIMVLEHLPDPEKALKEVWRILKPQGVFLLCTVENYPGHDFPYNYYHWTKFGLEEILKRNKLKIKKITSFGNFWETEIVYQNVFLMQIVKKLASKEKTIILGFLFLVLFAPVMIISNILAYIIGRRKVTEEYALAHLIVAKKL